MTFVDTATREGGRAHVSSADGGENGNRGPARVIENVRTAWHGEWGGYMLMGPVGLTLGLVLYLTRERDHC